MWAAEQPYPPVGYPGWWWLVGVLAMGGAVVAALAAWRRPRPVDAAGRGRAEVEAARRTCLAALDELDEECRVRRVSEHDLHHRLSAVVRAFVAESTGIDALAMTPGDLRGHGQDRAAEIVARCWDPQFAERTDHRPGGADAVAAARTLVAGWQA